MTITCFGLTTPSSETVASVGSVLYATILFQYLYFTPTGITVFESYYTLSHGHIPYILALGTNKMMVLLH